ncbi:MAG: single-stranded-DNA-specific exonuclease RecJ, partial [Solirubrobacterales bacterium]|nr:single-stranded-DNA-specific exonuclease RecJ [Solirubrobacterales bacterium]
EGKHARFTVQSRGARARGVAFGGGGRLPVEEGVAAEATFRLEVNEFHGVSEPRLVLRQARPVETPSGAGDEPGDAAALADEELVLFALP